MQEAIIILMGVVIIAETTLLSWTLWWQKRLLKLRNELVDAQSDVIKDLMDTVEGVFKEKRQKEAQYPTYEDFLKKYFPKDIGKVDENTDPKEIGKIWAEKAFRKFIESQEKDGQAS